MDHFTTQVTYEYSWTGVFDSFVVRFLLTETGNYNLETWGDAVKNFPTESRKTNLAFDVSHSNMHLLFSCENDGIDSWETKNPSGVVILDEDLGTFHEYLNYLNDIDFCVTCNKLSKQNCKYQARGIPGASKNSQQ